MPLSETILVIAVLLGIAVLAALICRRIPIPFTALLVLLGLALGWLDHIWAPLEALQSFRLSPDLVLFVFLPVLIFESGYSLDGRQLMKDIVPVMMLAIPALLISAALIGLGLWWLLDMDPVWALLFGALISATDPIAVIALFKELGAPLRLNVLVEGESLFNDATALVLFKVLLAMAAAGGLSWQQAGPAVGEFIRVFIGGIIVGALFGFAMSWLLRFVRSRSSVLTLSVVLAYAVFIVTEHLFHLSGVVAVVAASLILGTWGRSRMPQQVCDALHDTWGFLAFVCNVMLFMLVGLSIDPLLLYEYGTGIGIAILLILAARAVAIYSMVPLATRWFHLHTIGMQERHIMWWGGLKGGLAIAMVLSIPAEFAERDTLLALTVGLVIFTLLINAPTIRPLMRMLHMDRLHAQEAAELHAGMQQVSRCAKDVLENFRQVGVISRNARRQIAADLEATLKSGESLITQRARQRYIYLSLLSVELETLDTLFKAGVIPQYTRLDIRNDIQHERDQLTAGVKLTTLIRETGEPSLFGHIEASLVGWLREIGWLSPLFMQYQYQRLSHRFRRDIARLMMGEASLKHLHEDEGITAKEAETLEKHLQKRLDIARCSLTALKRDMPEFYRHLSFRIATQASWFAALTESTALHHHGRIGGKAYAAIKYAIVGQLDRLPPVTAEPPEATVAEVIRAVPLFAGLPETIISGLIERATTLTFLPEDRIIVQQEHGDSMYIILQGTVMVHHGSGKRTREMAILSEGEFFGEMALLGEHVRSVNVTAIHACKLLRLQRSDVLELAEKHPEIEQRLRDVEQQRRDTND